MNKSVSNRMMVGVVFVFSQKFRQMLLMVLMIVVEMVQFIIGMNLCDSMNLIVLGVINMLMVRMILMDDSIVIMVVDSIVNKL